MKDAKGHGSNKRTDSGGQAKSSNAEASKSFIQALGKTMQPVPVHDAFAGTALEGMTQQKWSSLSPMQREAIRDNSGLTPQLKGLEGHRVEVKDSPSSEPRRFIVGKSTGWRPAHLEISRTSARGGGTASRSYHSVRSLGKVR